jgi:hypothetical protein
MVSPALTTSSLLSAAATSSPRPPAITSLPRPAQRPPTATPVA